MFPLLQQLGYTNLSNDTLPTPDLLYGDKDFPDNLNKNMLLLTLHFIHRTGLFDKEILN